MPAPDSTASSAPLRSPATGERRRLSPWVAHAYIAVALLAAALHLGRSPFVAELVRVGMTATAIVAVLIGLHYNRTPHRAPWVLFALALLMFEFEQLSWLVNIAKGVRVDGLLSNTFDVLGFLILGAAAFLALRARSRRDVGGILDAAVVSFAGATLIWEFLLYGRLYAANTSMPVLTASLVQLLIVMVGLVILLRLAQTSAGSPATLCYFFVAVAGGFVQAVVFILVSGERTRVPGSLIETANYLAVVAIAAAALHPSMVQLTDAGPVVVDRLSSRRLLVLGAALVTGPVCIGIWQLLGHPADPVLLVVGTVAIVPLVMYRIRGLVTQRASAEAALAHQATHDTLTGLPNRAQFVALLEAAVQRVRSGASSHVCVLFCDLDDFKQVNDRLGHAAGDSLLIEVASRLRDCVRARDVVSRFGGDEFLILCENLSKAEVVDRIATRITLELEHPITLDTEQVTIAASIGVAVAAGHTLSAEGIIREADDAMYAMKHASPEPPQLSAVRSAGTG